MAVMVLRLPPPDFVGTARTYVVNNETLFSAGTKVVGFWCCLTAGVRRQAPRGGRQAVRDGQRQLHRGPVLHRAHQGRQPGRQGGMSARHICTVKAGGTRPEGEGGG